MLTPDEYLSARLLLAQLPERLDFDTVAQVRGEPPPYGDGRVAPPLGERVRSALQSYRNKPTAELLEFVVRHASRREVIEALAEKWAPAPPTLEQWLWLDVDQSVQFRNMAVVLAVLEERVSDTERAWQSLGIEDPLEVTSLGQARALKITRAAAKASSRASWAAAASAAVLTFTLVLRILQVAGIVPEAPAERPAPVEPAPAPPRGPDAGTR